MAGTVYDAARSFKRYIAAGLGPEWEVRLTAEEGVFHRPFCRIEFVGAASSKAHGQFVSELNLTAALIMYPKESATADEALYSAMKLEEQMFEITTVGKAYLPPVGHLAAVKSSGGSLSGSYRYSVVAVNRYGKTTASSVSVTGVNGKVTLTWTAMPEAIAYQVFRGAAGHELFLATTNDPTFVDDGTVALTPDTMLPATNTAKISWPHRVPLYDYEGVGALEAVTDAQRARGEFMRITEDPTTTRMVDKDDDLLWAVAANIRLSWVRSSAVPSTAPLISSFTTSEEQG